MLEKIGDDFAPSAVWLSRVKDHVGRRYIRMLEE